MDYAPRSWSPASFPTYIKYLLEIIPTNVSVSLHYQLACSEYEKIVAKQIASHGMKSIPPPAAEHQYCSSDLVYMYLDRDKH